jgi:hypothetical protein
MAAIATADDSEVFIQKGACPFECCTYGVWKVDSDTKVYKTPSLSAKVSGTLKAGSVVGVTTGEVHVVPGHARAIATPPQSAINLDPEALIEILDYVGEGYSRVRQGEIITQVKIARTKQQCEVAERHRYCWVEILREPVADWWVLLSSGSTYPGGWVRMTEGVGLRAIDSCG